MEKKTKAQYALAWIVPAILFSLAMMTNLRPLLDIEAAYRFADDESYIGLAAADSYKQARVYGLSIYEAMPATRDSLWHGVQIGVSWLTNKAPQAVLVLNYLFALLSIILTSVLARRWCPGPFSTFAATLLYALLPLTMLAGMQGRPQALILFLGAAAVVSHLKGLDGEGMPLSFRTALLVGLAAMVHVESVLLWILFGLHAFLVLPFTRRKGAMATASFQFIMGVFVLGICLWPLVHWNVMTMNVPWPTSMDAALTLDAAGQGAVTQSLDLDENLRASSATLLQTGLGVMVPIVLLGGIALIISSLKIKRLRLLLPVLVFPVALSAGVSSLALVTGQGGLGEVILLLVPMMVSLAVAALAYLPSFLKADLRLPGPLTLPGIMRGVGLLVLVVIAQLLTQAARVERDALLADVQECRQDREAWERQLGERGGVMKIATDHPGWAAFRYDHDVLDLTGRCSWRLLSCLSPYGGIDPEMYNKFIREAQPDLFVVWDTQGRKMARILGEKTSVASRRETVSAGSSQWFSLRWPQ